jgi:hypothetical protein
VVARHPQHRADERKGKEQHRGARGARSQRTLRLAGADSAGAAARRPPEEFREPKVEERRERPHAGSFGPHNSIDSWPHHLDSRNLRLHTGVDGRRRQRGPTGSYGSAPRCCRAGLRPACHRIPTHAKAPLMAARRPGAGGLPAGSPGSAGSEYGCSSAWDRWGQPELDIPSTH